MPGRRFLRRMSRWGDYNDSTIKDEVFRCKAADEVAEDPAAIGLSLTLVTPELEEDAFEQFVLSSRLDSGDQPGLCYVTEEDVLAAGLQPPRFYRDEAPFGDLHYLIDCPDESAANFLAARAFEHQIVRYFVHHKKGEKRIGNS